LDVNINMISILH